VAVAAVGRGEAEEGTALIGHEVDRPVVEHVGLEALGQADALPDPQYFLVCGDGAGTGVDRGVALDDEHSQAALT